MICRVCQAHHVTFKHRSTDVLVSEVSCLKSHSRFHANPSSESRTEWHGQRTVITVCFDSDSSLSRRFTARGDGNLELVRVPDLGTLGQRLYTKQIRANRRHRHRQQESVPSTQRFPKAYSGPVCTSLPKLVCQEIQAGPAAEKQALQFDYRFQGRLGSGIATGESSPRIPNSARNTLAALVDLNSPALSENFVQGSGSPLWLPSDPHSHTWSR